MGMCGTTRSRASSTTCRRCSWSLRAQDTPSPSDASPETATSGVALPTLQPLPRPHLHVCVVCREVYSWGYNGYGELGLGDTLLRLQPTRLTGPIETATVRDASCGSRHTVLLLDHRPQRVCDDPRLQPYLKIIEREPENDKLRAILRRDMRSKELNPDLLDTPLAHMPGQTASTAEPLKNEKFEKGLRYCLDTHGDPGDWRRKVYETTFECGYLKLKSICLTCARLCKNKYLLRPYIRKRAKGDVCDCSQRGLCLCRFTVARAAFDKICGEDQCIGPCQLRALLQSLRAPLLVEGADMEVCLLALAEGASEDSELPRIKPLAFEKWYEAYYD